jgi:RNA recognition motif-containing protein
MSKKLYVGNLPYSVGDQDLQDAFASFGEIVSVRVVTDRETGRSKGFGFVEMANDNDANTAIEKLNGSSLAGRAIQVSEARPQVRDGGGDRGPRRGGFGGPRGGGGGGNRGPRPPRRDDSY